MSRVSQQRPRDPFNGTLPPPSILGHLWIADPRGGTLVLRQRADESSAAFVERGDKLEMTLTLAKGLCDAAWRRHNRGAVTQRLEEGSLRLYARAARMVGEGGARVREVTVSTVTLGGAVRITIGDE